MKRRAALRRFAGGIFAAALASAASRSLLAAETARVLAQDASSSEDVARASFETFYALSGLVTCRSRLNVDAARKMYPFFFDEPWGTKHISAAYSELVRLIAKTPGECSAPALVAAGALPEGETWFCDHLLQTWYLGIYYHDRGDARVLYADALMWGTVVDFAKAPATTPGKPGYWASPPPRGAGGAACGEEKLPTAAFVVTMRPHGKRGTSPC